MRDTLYSQLENLQLIQNVIISTSTNTQTSNRFQSERRILTDPTPTISHFNTTRHAESDALDKAF